MFGYQSHVDLSMNGVRTLSDGYSVLRGGHIAGVSGSFGALTSPEIRGNKEDIDEIKRNIDTNATLGGRVDTLETEVAGIRIDQTDIDALLVEMDTAQADIAVLQQDDVSLRKEAAELQGGVAAIGYDLLMTQADVMTLQTVTAATRFDVTALESKSDATQAEITALQGSVAAIPGVDISPNRTGGSNFPAPGTEAFPATSQPAFTLTVTSNFSMEVQLSTPIEVFASWSGGSGGQMTSLGKGDREILQKTAEQIAGG
jgi:hypothetical protein